MAEAAAPESLSDILATLRRMRRLRELTLKEVAAKVGVTLQSIQQFETGDTRPTESVMRKWLRALDAPASWNELYAEYRKIEDIDRILGTMNLPQEQLAAQRVSLRNALRVRRERR